MNESMNACTYVCMYAHMHPCIHVYACVCRRTDGRHRDRLGTGYRGYRVQGTRGIGYRVQGVQGTRLATDRRKTSGSAVMSPSYYLLLTTDGPTEDIGIGCDEPIACSSTHSHNAPLPLRLSQRIGCMHMGGCMRMEGCMHAWEGCT